MNNNWVFSTWLKGIRNPHALTPNAQPIVSKPAIINPEYYKPPNDSFIPFEDAKPYPYTTIITTPKKKEAPRKEPVITFPITKPTYHKENPPIKIEKKKEPERIENNHRKATQNVDYIECKKVTKKQRKESKEEDKGVKGKCLGMCSVTEIEARQSINDWSIFELDREKYKTTRLKNDDPQIISPKYAVKKYERSAANRKMNDEDAIRPPSVLLKTINYLITEILDYDKASPKYSNCKFVEDPRYNIKEEIFLFFSDRSRAIRQDFIVLNNHSERNCIQTFERIARFHLLASNEFAEQEQFNDMQNSQQLSATLTSLRDFYYHSRKKLFLCKDAYKSPNEAEFFAYSLLWNINDRVKLEEIMISIPKDLLTSVEVYM